jgi:peptidyl-prolyl cis-trans isomerase D
MLKTMRRITKPIMWLVAITFVGFLGWQGVFTNQNAPNTIAKINGEDISYELYNAYHNRNYRLAQQQYGDTVEFDDFVNRLIRESTWDELVTQIISAQEAKKRGIEVTDREVFEYLRRFPPAEIIQDEFFRTEEGGFDYNKYAQALLDPQFEQFWIPIENYVRERLLIGKLQMMITSLARVSREDIENQWLKAEATLNVRFVKPPLGAFMQEIQPGQGELEQFYADNGWRFAKPERAEVYYVEFAKTSQESDEQQVKQKLEELKAQIESDSDFVKLARQYSEDQATREACGDLGWIEAEGFIPALEGVLKNLEPGEVSPPVKSNFGWHLLKLWDTKIQEGKKQYLLSHILIKAQLSERSLKELKTKAEGFARAAESNGFEKAAHEQNLRVGQTGWFSPQGFIQGFGQDQEVHSFAFNSKIGAISRIIETPSAFYVLQLKDHRPAGADPLVDIRPDVETAYKREKTLQRSLEQVKRVYTQVQQGKSLAQAAKSENLAVLETGEFEASDELIPKVGRNPKFLEAALEIKSPGQVSPPILDRDGVFLMELISREGPSEAEFAEAGDSLFQATLEEEQSRLYSEWFERLRESAEIKDYRDRFFSEEAIPEEVLPGG